MQDLFTQGLFSCWGRGCNTDTNIYPNGTTNPVPFIYTDQAIFNSYFELLINIAANRLRFKNMPDGVNIPFLMLASVQTAMVTIFKDEVLDDFIGVMAVPKQFVAPYGLPGEWEGQGFGNDSHYFGLNNTNAVIIYDNYLHIPIMYKLQEFARRLTDIQAAIDINIREQRNPMILEYEENKRVSVRKFLQKLQNNEVYLHTTPDMLNGIRLFNTKPDYRGKDLMVAKRHIIYDCLSFLGIGSNYIDKAERQISSEVTGSMGETMANRAVTLNSWQEGLDRFNRLFNKDVEVMYNEEIERLTDQLLKDTIQTEDDVEGWDEQK